LATGAALPYHQRPRVAAVHRARMPAAGFCRNSERAA